MWLREYTSLSPVRTNHRLCQICRLEPHFIRYPEIMTLEVSMDPGCFEGEALSEGVAVFVFFEGPDVLGKASSESDDVRW